MQKVMFVCTGNTCRSPMAEGMFRAYLNEMQMGFISVQSAGLAASCGSPPTDNAVWAAHQFGADIASHRSRALTAYDFTDETYFICMTDAHAALLRSYAPAARIQVLDIADPFMGDTDVYLACASAIRAKLPTVFRFVFGFDRISRLQRQDVDGVLQIETACFSHPWTLEGITQELENPTARFFTARKDDAPIGYIGANNIAGEVYITNLAVLSDYRKQGIGALLLSVLLEQAAYEHAQFVTLEVRESNLPAISLYEKYGFSAVGRRNRFYRDPPEDALLYTKFLYNGNEGSQ